MIPMCSESVRKRLLPVLRKLNLPTSTDFEYDKLIAAMRHDKKLMGDKITVIFVPEAGKFEMREMPFGDFAKEIKESFK